MNMLVCNQNHNTERNKIYIISFYNQSNHKIKQTQLKVLKSFKLISIHKTFAYLNRAFTFWIKSEGEKREMGFGEERGGV